MLPNVNQLTSQFARMSDQQLQQYATMHKSDPYVISLALSESNRRKETRNSQQGQMGQQQQPRVVDQAIAGMSQGLPENSGIGMLPAPNMQGMASGGITGFSGEDGSFVSDGRATTAFERFIGDIFGPEPREGVSTEGMAAAQKKRDDQAKLDAFNNSKQQRINALKPHVFKALTQGERDRITQEIMAIEAELPPGVSNAYPDTNAQRFPAPAAAPGNTISQSTGRGGPAVGEVARYQATQNNQTGTSGSGIGQPRTAVAAAVPDENYMTRLDAIRAKQRPAVADFAPEIQSINDLEKRNAQTYKDELDAEIAARGVAGKGQEERIAKREAGITADRQTNKAFSFINAGLAMMQSRGRGLSGIAEGAMVGTKQYSEGMAKINLAQEKADEARDKLDELRRNESTMNAKEVRAAKADIRTTAVNAEKAMLEAVMKATKLNRDDALAAVASDSSREEKAKDRASAERRAQNLNAGPGMGLGEQRIQLDALKTQLTGVNAALNNRNSMLDLPRNAGQKATLLAERQQLMADIARFGPPSSANPVAPSAVSGTGDDGFKVLGSRPAP